MANRQINLNYCAECQQIDKANIFNCRWLQFDFCALTCLKQFYAKIVIACDLCERKFDQNNRVHVRDDVPNHLQNSYAFICDECFDRRSVLATRCHYCTKVCYKGFGAQLITATGSIYFSHSFTNYHMCILVLLNSIDCKMQTVFRI